MRIIVAPRRPPCSTRNWCFMDYLDAGLSDEGFEEEGVVVGGATGGDGREG